MNKLDEIFAYKRAELREKADLAEIKARAQDASPCRGFHQSLLHAGRLGLIAEVKKASPVAGLLREDFDPVAIAQSYQRAGAECLSVLTDEPFFQGSTENLVRVRSVVPMPVLRKDFTAGEYHVYEARAMGADAILLIVYGLSDSELREYRELAEDLGMDVLVEAHSIAEAERALAAGARLLGINNRDLTTFEMSVEVGERTLPHFVGRATLVGESALRTSDDVQRMAAAGAQAVLIGSVFSESPDIESKVREVMGRE